jgi:hypothetical protein
VYSFFSCYYIFQFPRWTSLQQPPPASIFSRMKGQYLLSRRRHFPRQTGLIFKEESSIGMDLLNSFLWCLYLDSLEIRSEIPAKFWSIVLETDGVNRIYLVRNGGVLCRVREKMNILQLEILLVALQDCGYWSATRSGCPEKLTTVHTESDTNKLNKRIS